MAKRFYTVKEVAETGLCSARLLADFVHIDGFPAYKTGSVWKIDLEQMLAWLKAKEKEEKK